MDEIKLLYIDLFCGAGGTSTGVENVIPYYEPLIHGKKRGRHLYWTNFNLPNSLNERQSVSMECKDEVKKMVCFSRL